MSNILMWIIAVFMIVIGAYTGYQNLKAWNQSKEVKAAFLKNNKDAKTVLISRSRAGGFVGLSAVSFALAIFLGVANLDFEPSVRFSQVAVYLGLGVFSGAMVFQALMDSEVVYSSDAFVLATEVIRFRNINRLEVPKKGFWSFTKPCFMVLAGNKEESIPKTVGRWLEGAMVTWKKERKETRRSAKGRRK